MSTEVYTLTDVKKHNTAKDCWMIIHGKVYNVTAFLDEHPGGAEIMVELAGQDATEAFDDIGHSLDAKKLLADFLVGTVEGGAAAAAGAGAAEGATGGNCIVQ
ncbi:UNVERIFIED_CONTAM: Cytochrome b5 [Siphonaria sp. JEL0065]|nr:Cytochrome b5 [Siphonaria sp. JEL0065]